MIAFLQMAAKRGGGGKKGAAQASPDAEPLASATDIPPPEPATGGRNIPAWIGACGSIASMAISVVALVRASSSDASKSATEMSALRRDVDIVLKWIRYRDPAFPGGKTITTPEPQPRVSAPPPDQIAPESTVLTNAPRLAPLPRPENSAFPEDVPTTHPPRCISRQTKKPVSCTPELACRPAGKVYAPAFRKQVVSETAGIEVTADTLVCEP
jgi:hypothetical protein